MESKIKKDRMEWLDVGKGIGILLVILGHSVTTSIRNDSQIVMLLYNLVFFMHMPFLFCLSGYGFQLAQRRYFQMNAKKFLIKKAKVLLVPYVSCSLLIYLIFTICNRLPVIKIIAEKAGYGKMSITEWIMGLLIGDNHYSLHLWYIYVLFFFVVLTYILKKMWKSQWLTLGVAITFLVLLKSAELDGFVAAVPNFLYMYIWFVLGSIISFEKINRKNALGAFLVAMIFWGMQQWNPVLQNNTWTIYFVTIAMKGLAVIGLIGFTQWISKKGNKFLSYLGQHSFEVYLFHQPFLGSCYGSLLYVFLKIPMFLVVITSVGLSIIVPLFISKFLGKTKYLKKIFGTCR